MSPASETSCLLELPSWDAPEFLAFCKAINVHCVKLLFEGNFHAATNKTMFWGPFFYWVVVVLSSCSVEIVLNILNTNLLLVTWAQISSPNIWLVFLPYLWCFFITKVSHFRESNLAGFFVVVVPLSCLCSSYLMLKIPHCLDDKKRSSSAFFFKCFKEFLDL